MEYDMAGATTGGEGGVVEPYEVRPRKRYAIDFRMKEQASLRDFLAQKQSLVRMGPRTDGMPPRPSCFGCNASKEERS
jgi:hypothetical protein